MAPAGSKFEAEFALSSEGSLRLRGFDGGALAGGVGLGELVSSGMEDKKGGYVTTSRWPAF